MTSRTVVLGVCGSIAAYKAADLASKLTQRGARVNVIMTRSAREFVTPMTFRAITHQPVVTEMFELASEFSIEHVALAEAADLVLVAPATANVIAKLGTGIADDMLSCTVLATKAPVVMAPAMNVNMYENQVTQENIGKLASRGFVFVGPAYGRLASGIEGLGRLADVEEILGVVSQVLGRRGDLAGKRILVTAGGTQEPIDAVRHISNRSSGKMGFALAQAARDRGAMITLIAAPTSLPPLPGVETVQVQTAEEMQQEVNRAAPEAHVLVMAAAVADYRLRTPFTGKLKKTSSSLTLELERTVDILGQVQGYLVKVGFAAESEALVENATKKLEEKHLDLIVANDITDPESGFGADTNRVVLIERGGRVEALPLLSKIEVAHRILDRVAGLLR